MMSLVNFDDRIGMPNLLGWDPSRVLDQLFVPFGGTPVKVTHDQDRVVITADVPGVDPSDLDVTFEAGVLHISGQRDGRDYRYAIHFGEQYNADTIDAQLVNGVLTIAAEKRPEAKPRKIPLKGTEAKSLESGSTE